MLEQAVMRGSLSSIKCIWILFHCAFAIVSVRWNPITYEDYFIVN